MWRSFFYSIGIGLFVLGLQSLVVDHVTVPKDTKLQKLIKKILSDDKPKVAAAQAIPPAIEIQPAYGNQSAYGNANSYGNQPNWNQQNQQAQYRPANQSFGGVNNGSRFGPSRFAGPAYGTGYGGPRVTSMPSNQSNFRGQYQNGPNAQLAGYRAPDSARPAVKKQVAIQKVLVREWMPWSLLASGAIIFLYTHTLHRRRNHE